MYRVILSAFVGSCIGCKNMHGMSNIKSIQTICRNSFSHL